MEIKLDKEAALIETVLFLESEPLDEASLSRITGLSRDVVDGALELLGEECRASNSRGLEPLRSGGGWILAPKGELWESLKERYGKKNENRLSKAALETLSIVAYKQPITRAEIEAIRGVSADGMIRFLLDHEFVKEVGKKEAPGRPVQYGTTKEFLKYFRLGSIADLPRLDELEQGRFGLEQEAPADTEGPELAGAESAAEAKGAELANEESAAAEGSPAAQPEPAPKPEPAPESPAEGEPPAPDEPQHG